MATAIRTARRKPSEAEAKEAIRILAAARTTSIDKREIDLAGSTLAEYIHPTIAKLINSLRGRLGFRLADIEDYHQLALLACLESCDKFDLTRQIEPWFWQIAHHTVISELQKIHAKNAGKFTLSYFDALPDGEHVVSNALIQIPRIDVSEELKTKLKELIPLLSPMELSVLLVYVKFYSGTSRYYIDQAIELLASRGIKITAKQIDNTLSRIRIKIAGLKRDTHQDIPPPLSAIGRREDVSP